jgi:hypothetical protein
VTGHALAVIEDLLGGGHEAHVDLLADHEIRNALEVFLNDEVAVNIDPSFAVLGMLVAGSGKTAICSGCGRLYAPQRKPKRGYDNFCPERRAAKVPQRLHMRRKRAGG